MNTTETISVETTAGQTSAAGLCLRRGGRGWRVVHTSSGLHLPMVTWPTDDVPRAVAERVLASLACSGVDWTRSAAELRADLDRVAAAIRVAAVSAHASGKAAA